ncbi:hypothetical protein EDB81DRAFT_127951 [Dactylonectria macrodidyma]|uniref:Fork-head domain-containing protein n=1 Tax=Dactylonectria macrodidyma TaxID=307937 RepID=A0A9P9IUM8_9HYPO|nr:hypothetical protein EDB81DRAFT_127951 [Dactylonectria macrodidyma]
MSNNSFPHTLVPTSRRHAAAPASNELDLVGQSWPAAETELAPTTELSSPWQVPGDWRLGSSSDPALLELCQYWHNAGWQQCFSQFSLQTNATASLAGYAAQGAWWQQQDQSPSLPESGTQSLNLPESDTQSLNLPESGTQSLILPESSTQSSPPTNFRLGSTDGLLGPSGASSDHDHRDPATCHCCYDELLMEAFRSNPTKSLSKNDIRRWLETYTHITTSKTTVTWQAGIRRNLTTCKTSKKYHREGERWVMREPK